MKSGMTNNPGGALPDSIATKIVQRLQVLRDEGKEQSVRAENFRQETKENYKRLEGKIDSVLESIDQIHRVEARGIDNEENIMLLNKSIEKQWSRVDELETRLKPIEDEFVQKREQKKELFSGLLLPIAAGVGIVGILGVFGLLGVGLTVRYLSPPPRYSPPTSSPIEPNPQ